MTYGQPALIDLVESFAKTEWDWSPSGFHRTVESLNLSLKNKIGTRLIYLTSAGNEIDVYTQSSRPVSVEAVLDHKEVAQLDESSYEDSVDLFYSKFKNTVALVSSSLGQPVFCDGQAATRFPEDQDAVWLALWRLSTARLMIQLKHEGRDVPFRISFIAAPLS